MGKALVHNELQVTIPATFVQMTPGELKQVFLDDNPNRWGARDVRMHRMIVISWQDSNGLLAKLVSTNSLIKRVEKLSAKGYGGYGYQFGSFFKRSLCGLEAEGFDFTYELKGIGQKAQNIVFKHGKTCYTLYWVERAGEGKAGERARESILESMALAG